MTEHLNNAKLQLFTRLYEQVSNATDRAVHFYTTESDRLKLDWHNRKWHDGTITGVAFNGVEIKWDEYHKGCRTAGGEFHIHWDALADSTYKEYITAMVEKHVATQQAEMNAKADRVLAYKRSQLATLRAELGDV